jgi:hypothetical protein
MLYTSLANSCGLQPAISTKLAKPKFNRFQQLFAFKDAKLAGPNGNEFYSVSLSAQSVQ